MLRLRRIILGMGLLVAGGCSPDWYRQSADWQVQDILADREKRTLDYQAQVDVGAGTAPEPSKSAYEKLPLTPVAPEGASALSVSREPHPAGPLGPETWRLEETADPGAQFAQDLIQRRQRYQPFAGPPAPNQLAARLDLLGCIEYAVQHSREYQDEMDRLYISALNVTLQRHLFSPRPFATTGLEYSREREDADVSYRTALKQTNTVGVRQQLPYGGEVVASGLVDFVDALHGNADDGESASAVLSGSMPLLRGFGMVNLEPLINGERTLVYQVRSFEDFRRAFAVQIASRYFELLAQQQRVKNRQLSVKNLSALTERTQSLFDAGKIGFQEVQRSLQSQLSAEGSLIQAEEAYQTALDGFKLVLGMPVDKDFDVAPLSLDVPTPKITIEQAVAIAHQYRLSLKTASDLVEDAQRGVRNAANGLLPDLNLTGSAVLGNEPDRPAFEIRDSTLSYRAGVVLDLPLDRVRERNIYRESLIFFQQAQRKYSLERDAIAADVREAMRNIKAAEITLEIQRRGIELANRRLEFNNELLRQSKVTARDLVEAQTSLLDAQDAYARALADLQIRVLNYLRDTGTLRLDPKSGALGKVMDREALLKANKTALAR